MSWKQFQPIPSAIGLKRVGVKVVRCENATSFLDIRFNKGVLEIPSVFVESCTECIFRNLLAFEFHFRDDANFMASYVCLMSCLIKSKEDMEFLESPDYLQCIRH
ncbi:hypothetical protein Syun_028686 [Stephania yunnanensis]|uniref:Uncharacterized protein n=1 Tax=Stephania yunnanensis TaxID=152371 RepID=A0AAP0HIR9_9MAGN